MLLLLLPLLRWLWLLWVLVPQGHCTRPGGSWWVLKEPEANVVRVFDLATLSAEYGADANPFAHSVALMCYRMALRCHVQPSGGADGSVADGGGGCGGRGQRGSEARSGGGSGGGGSQGERAAVPGAGAGGVDNDDDDDDDDDWSGAGAQVGAATDCH